MTVYRAANLNWGQGGDASLVKTLAQGADVLLLVECRDRDNQPIDIRGILGVEWRVWQNLRDGARAGCAIAVRQDAVKWRRAIPSRLRPLSAPGKDVQTRYLRTVRLIDDDGPVTIGVAHLPLDDTGRQDDAVRTLRKWWRTGTGRRAVFGDGNQSHDALKVKLGAHHSCGADVMFAIRSTGWPAMTCKAARMNGTDHNVLTLTPKEK